MESDLQSGARFDGYDITITLRRPIANIMDEARNNAEELRAVFDNAVFTQNHLIAGCYFVVRVSLNYLGLQ